MGKILECAKRFKKLTNIKYNIVIGRKGQLQNIVLEFRESNFHHLLGLHKLVDLRGISNRNKQQVFDLILSNLEIEEQIKNSIYFNKIENRIDVLLNLEELLDSNNMIFKYNQNVLSFSLLKADFLLSNSLYDKNAYVFLKRNIDDRYYCCSLFYESDIDYTVNQVKYTLLYKEKINKITGEKVIQFDKLKK